MIDSARRQDDVLNPRAAVLLQWRLDRDGGPTLAGAGRDDAIHASRRPWGLVWFEGYLFDREQLCLQLALPQDSGPTDIVAAAYEGDDDSTLFNLRGGYLLVIWDAERERLIAVRDATGLRPAFYCWDGNRLCVSSSLDRIVDEVPKPPRLHRSALAEYLLGALTDRMRQETFYRDVLRLPPGHCLEVERRSGRLSVSRYWDPLGPGFAWATAEEGEEFSARLRQATGRCLEAGADCLALSGGYDSVSLAVLAAQLRGRQAPLHAVSLRFDPGPCDEGETQIAVARQLDMPQTILTIRESLDGVDPVEEALRLSADLPGPVLSVWQSMYSGLLRVAGDQKCSQMLMGTGGDDLLTVDLSYGADLLSHGSLKALWKFYRSWQRTSSLPPAVVAREVLWRSSINVVTRAAAVSSLQRTVPALTENLRRRAWQHRLASGWLAPTDAELRDELLQRRLEHARSSIGGGSRYVTTLRRLLLSPLLLLEMEQGFAWAKSLGFGLLYPFFDRDVAELTLRLRPETLLAGGWSKAPLRRLVAQQLSSMPDHRKKVDFTHMIHRVLRPGGVRVWRTMRRSLTIGELGIGDVDKLRSTVDGYFDASNDAWFRVWQLMATEAWVRARF